MKIYNVPQGKLRSDDAAAAKRRELMERLKRGEDVSVTSTGKIVKPNEVTSDDGRTLKAPEGKLAV